MGNIKKGLLVFIFMVFIFSPAVSFAVMGTMEPKSKDVDVKFFGSLKTYPTFLSNMDLNDSDTGFDFIIDENGRMADHNIRNEIRVGWTVKGENWDFLAILESDFNLNKANGDRGSDGSSPDDSGMTGEDFGVEKLNVSYDFGPFAVKAGWDTRFLDIQTGGLLYGDDHPYIGFDGKVNDNVSWEALYLIIQDETIDSIGALDKTSLDWRVYSLKLNYKLDNGFTISPFYAYSDNDEANAANAKVHYLGAEGYGKLGMITPRFELVYANGDTDTYADTGKDYDISALAGYASADINISSSVIPYFGVTYESGDDDANDDDIDAFNGITNISRYTPTFGMENAFIYRFIPVLGSHLYSNNFATLGGGLTPGYGGISNSSTGNSPGLLSYGIGVKGKIDKFAYKAQILFMTFEDAGALENMLGKSIDDYVGTEFDLHLSYKFGKHFTLGNCLSVFEPGDAVKDIRGDEYDEIGILNTVEMTWTF